MSISAWFSPAHMILYNHPQSLIESFFEGKKTQNIVSLFIILCLRGSGFVSPSLLLFPGVNFLEPLGLFQDIIALLGIPLRARL